jgi:hypothetical protein
MAVMRVGSVLIGNLVGGLKATLFRRAQPV